MRDLVGQNLGGYSILEQIGAGGMGAVFKARQPVLDRLVALKVIAQQMAQDASYIARFQQEAKSAARLNHPNIVQVYAAGEDRGIHFFVEEFVEGESLQDRLSREKRMDPQESLAVCVFVAEGLKYAWDEARIIHRDIKPANIFLSNKGAVKVGDLGLAKSVGPEASAGLTQSGATVGTPFYMSPEQAQAEKELDFRTDIYSLGCTLYHMLSGKKPYEDGPSQSPMSVIIKQATAPPPVILQVLPTCPPPVVLLLTKMLAKQAGARHQNYDELIADLRRVHDLLGQPKASAPISSSLRGAPTKKKSPAMVYSVAAAAAAAIVGIGVVLWAPWKQSEQKALNSEAAKTQSAPVAQTLLSVAAASPKEESKPVSGALAENVGGASAPRPAVAQSEPAADRGVDATPTFQQPAAQLAQATSHQTTAPSTQPTVASTLVNEPWDDAVNLLPLIDLKKDAVEGMWKVEKNELVSDDAQSARIEIPYLPPQEYDFRVTFTRIGGNEQVTQILSARGRCFVWMMGGHGGRVFGLTKSKNGAFTVEYATSHCMVETGRKHCSLIRVRKTGVECYFDSVLIAEHKAGDRELTINATWALRDQRLMGLGSQTSPTVFHAIELREVGAKGKPVRLAHVAASGAQTSTAAQSQPADEAFVKSVGAMQPEQQVQAVITKLKELNPNFDGKETHKIEGGVVTTLAFSSVGVADISPVKALRWLRTLSITPPALNQKGLLENLSPLQGMQLTWLWCHNNPITDLSPLKGMPLTVLSFGGTQVSDLSPLIGMKLQVLSFNDTVVSELGPLEGMPLTVLWCNNTKVADLTPLKPMPLRELKCDFVAERDAVVLRGIKSLAKINDLPAATFWMRAGPVAQTAIANLTPAAGASSAATASSKLTTPTSGSGGLSAKKQIEQFVAKMKELNPEFDGQVKTETEFGKVVSLELSTIGVSDISPLRPFTSLRMLRACGSKTQQGKVSYLLPLAGLPLSELYINYNPVIDLAPLKGMKLTRLNLESTKVVDLSPLENMPITWLRCPVTVASFEPLKGMPLTFLGATCYSVSDLTPLKGMKLTTFDCHGSSVADLRPLLGMSFELLAFQKTKVTDISPLQGMTIIQLNGDFVADRDLNILRSIKKLQTINGIPRAEFLKRLEKGEAPQAK